MSDFADISIDFYPKKAMEFIAAAAVFKWELAQHVTAVSKLFWRSQIFTLETLTKGKKTKKSPNFEGLYFTIVLSILAKIWYVESWR